MNAFSRFAAQWGIEYPIIQAPMAGVSTPKLAAAVSDAGGLGSLGVGASTADEARRMIRDTRALTARPFNVNVFCHAPAQRDGERERAWLWYLDPLFAECEADAPTSLDEIYRTFVGDDAFLQMLLDERPAVVSFHFGLPPQAHVRALRDAGIRTAATATNPGEAAAIEAAGIDAIVAQGIEAGGHRGMFDPDAPDEQLSTAVLVRLLLRQTRLPVIAAGGVMDGQGIRAMLDLGASAVQLGTAFLLCPESAANGPYRESLKSERAARTRLTTVLSGRPARGIVNRLVEYGEAEVGPRPPAYPVTYDATKRLNAAAAKQGMHDFAVQWAGQGAPLARELPAADLVRQLAAEWKEGGQK
ncbi:nitronate monooxygenase [Burkholderia sp. WAC0059]|uniref:NAD(P)H-dependent flavin oxidoreductase n=1 Tax=Burkholderia sp. WAC0059 TaxID=2066022 RepID=UPI000C7F5CA7|nr:nitronate monooxygenase [Burkholderia sp. WAC0059]PLZ03783.1 nitronate monooxygenase [Burkholderia sp. WAC0059]